MSQYVSHYVKKRLEKIKNSIDEVKFLTSEGYRRFLKKVVTGITGNYDLDVVFSRVVATDNKVIYLDPVHPYLMSLPGLAQKTLVILGQLAHEIFHLLFTDFRVLKQLRKDFEKEGDFRMEQVHESLNIIEDSACELAGTNYYTGSFSLAIRANNECAFNNMPSLDEMAENKVPRLVIFKQACAMYAIIGLLKGKITDPELLDMFKRAIPILDAGRLGETTWVRYEYAKKLYNLMLPLIEEVEKNRQQSAVSQNYKYTKPSEMRGTENNAKSMPTISEDAQLKNRKQTKKLIEKQAAKASGQQDAQDDDKQQQSENTQAGDQSGKNQKSGNKNSSQNPGKSSKTEEENDGGNAGDAGNRENGNTENAEDSSSENAKDEDTKDSDTGENGKPEAENGTEENSDEDVTGDGSSGENEEEGESIDSGDADGNESDGEDADGDTENKDTRSNEDDKDGKTGENSEEDEDAETDGNENTDADADSNEEDEDSEVEEYLKSLEKQLEQVREDIARDEFNKEEQKKQDEAIREFSKTVQYSDLHRGISVNTIRKFNITEIMEEYYETQFNEIRGLTRNMIKRLQDIIRFNEDEKVTGLYTGKVDRSRLYRMDKKTFYKRSEKSDEADLAILVLVDQSSSMNDANRIGYARLACMMLYEVCKALKIPYAVIGHSAVYNRPVVQHRHFVDFDSRDPKEKIKLAHMVTYDNTREGVSLKYAGEYLLRRPESDKILISISDGDPYHPSGDDIYCDDVAQKDTGRVVKELEARGLKIFGLAIGDGKSEIKKIYTHNFIDIPNISLLPARLVSLIERNLFK